MIAHDVLGEDAAVRLETVDLESKPWLDLLAESPAATAFHHPAWVRTVSECYAFRAFGLALADARGRLVSGLPVVEVKGPFQRRHWVSLPFTDSSPPLTRDGEAAGLAGFVHAEAHRRGVSELRVRGELPPDQLVHAQQVAVRHTLTLEGDIHDVERRIAKMHRRNIVKAERSGIVVERGTSDSDVETFYRLHVLTRQRLGVPVQPRRFFSSLQQHMLARDLGFVLTARLGTQPVASAVFLCWNDHLIYKYGASDSRFLALRPNNALFWAAIRWAVHERYRLIDWGRSDFEDEGLRAFKAGWGAIEQPLIYSTIGAARPRHSATPAHRLIATVVRRSPPWVGRVLGELLYRYAA
jgi:CelD/BcsL family acetyltransferase involved in cellulose biosynthesis